MHALKKGKNKKQMTNLGRDQKRRGQKRARAKMEERAAEKIIIKDSLKKNQEIKTNG